MKNFLFLLVLITSQAFADKSLPEFYEPSTANNYQGRLVYNSAKESYPIGKMKSLCEQFTGIDTAQIKCKKQKNKDTSICEYKCSLHWLTN